VALRTPRPFAVHARASEGTGLDSAVQQDRLVVTPVRHQYRLRDLLKGITTRNRHSEASTGKAVGKEIW
jgi:antitoxin component of MazEF toxin-antitoxin module